MIETPIFYKFHTQEYLSFSDRSIQILNRYNLEELGLVSPVESVTSAHDQLSETLTKAVLTEFTADVVEADTLRDNAFVAFKYYLQACIRSNKTEWQEASELLLARVRHYGWSMHNSSYNKQTTQTLNLLNDLENMPEMVEAITTVNATIWVDELKTRQLAFLQSLEIRTQAKANQTKTSNEEAVKEVRQAYESLFKYIEALEVISPLETRQGLINEINTVIKEFNTNIKSRVTRLETASEE